jgi:tetratricopeptide (TPR) repeat protein
MERAIPPRRSVALSFLGGMWAIGSVFYIGVQFIWVGKGVQYAIPMFFGALSLGLAVALLQRYRWAYILSIVLALVLFVISVQEHFWPLVLMLFLLLGRSYRDFFGKQERFIPRLIQGTHQEHYEAGRQYRDRGMWFMAVQEWLEAVQRQPGNSSYLQALGLGYAKIGQFDQALRVLHQALELNPNNGRIQEVIKTIEQQHAGSHA